MYTIQTFNIILYTSCFLEQVNNKHYVQLTMYKNLTMISSNIEQGVKTLQH